MNCLNNDYYFKRENKTIYQQFYIIEKQTGFFTTINDEIAFITEKTTL